MRPSTGDRGGYLMGSGPPEAIAKIRNSYTGQYLARILNGDGIDRSDGKK